MVQEILKNCTIEGMIVKIPSSQLDRKTYLEVSKKIELIGGKWKGGKTQGFVFEEDPTDLLEQICEGYNGNIKKEFQFFETPRELVEKLISLANPKTSDNILEPSAGQGAIVKGIIDYCTPLEIHGYELMPLNHKFLNKISSFKLIGDNFLDANESVAGYDIIIANPPFSKNQDIDHILKMWAVLRDGGRIVSIASNSWRNGTQKKQIKFKDWLKERNVDIIEVPAGSFKQSGTSIGACIIVINKLY